MCLQMSIRFLAKMDLFFVTLISYLAGIPCVYNGFLRQSACCFRQNSNRIFKSKSRTWLSALFSLTTEGIAQLKQKSFKSAVGALIERPVRHGRTICRRQIQYGGHNTCVWIVCSRKRCLLCKRGRSMSAPTAWLLT